MDPFTLITGIGGLSSLTIQVTQLLTAYASSVQDAPLFATEVAGETSVLSLILKELHEFLRDVHQQSETKIDTHSLQQILRDCKATMLQLDLQMTGLKEFGAGKQLKKRFKWAYEEAAITRILVQLQNHKRSLTLLLQLYVCKSTIEASKGTLVPRFTCADELLPRYDDYLKETRVYRHVKRKDSIDSNGTADTRQTAWSRFPESISSGAFSTYAFYAIPWTGTESISAHEFDTDDDCSTTHSVPSALSVNAWHGEALARIRNHVVSSPASSVSGAHRVRIATGNETRKYELLPRVAGSSGALHRWITNYESWITNYDRSERLSVGDAIMKAEKAKLF